MRCDRLRGEGSNLRIDLLAMDVKLTDGIIL